MYIRQQEKLKIVRPLPSLYIVTHQLMFQNSKNSRPSSRCNASTSTSSTNTCLSLSSLPFPLPPFPPSPRRCVR